MGERTYLFLLVLRWLEITPRRARSVVARRGGAPSRGIWGCYPAQCPSLVWGRDGVDGFIPTYLQFVDTTVPYRGSWVHSDDELRSAMQKAIFPNGPKLGQSKDFDSREHHEANAEPESDSGSDHDSGTYSDSTAPHFI